MVPGNYRRGDIPGIDRAVCRDRDSQSLGKRRQEGSARGQAAFCVTQEGAPDSGPGREAEKVNFGPCVSIQKNKSAQLSTLTTSSVSSGRHLLAVLPLSTCRCGPC